MNTTSAIPVVAPQPKRAKANICPHRRRSNPTHHIDEGSCVLCVQSPGLTQTCSMGGNEVMSEIYAILEACSPPPTKRKMPQQKNASPSSRRVFSAPTSSRKFFKKPKSVYGITPPNRASNPLAELMESHRRLHEDELFLPSPPTQSRHRKALSDVPQSLLRSPPLTHRRKSQFFTSPTISHRAPSPAPFPLMYDSTFNRHEDVVDALGEDIGLFKFSPPTPTPRSLESLEDSPITTWSPLSVTSVES